MMMLVIAGVIVLLVIVFVAMYNGLVRAKVRVDEAWSDITVQLKRRLDLIPNLVNTVKGYAAHEEGVFTKVTEARTRALNAQGVKETAAAENQFEGALKSLFAVAESYPQLRASENFQKLQDELTDTEDKLMAARRFYNGSARDLNIKTEVFPSNMVAALAGVQKREFFELDEQEVAAAQSTPEVKF